MARENGIGADARSNKTAYTFYKKNNTANNLQPVCGR